jgi:hypothetical protein
VMKGDRRKSPIWTNRNNATELWKTSLLQNGKVSCVVATKNQSIWQGDGSSVKANWVKKVLSTWVLLPAVLGLWLI